MPRVARGRRGHRPVHRHCEAARAPPCPPSLRGREAAEAIQAGGAASDVREAYRVALPDSGLLRARFARARNDGGAAVPRVAGGWREHGPVHRHCAGGRRTVWPCPILDCFALASLALAMTGNERPACRRGLVRGWIICKNSSFGEAGMISQRLRLTFMALIASVPIASAPLAPRPAAAADGVRGAAPLWLACEDGRNYPLRPLAVSRENDLVTGYLLQTGRGRAVHLRLVPMGVGYRYAGPGIWFDGLRGEAVLNWGRPYAVACTVEQD